MSHVKYGVEQELEKQATITADDEDEKKPDPKVEPKTEKKKDEN